MRTWLALAFLVAGCNNNGGTTGNDGGTQLSPSVSSLEPSTAFLGRTLDVHLAGFATTWADSTTVSFGDGITVNKVTAGSATGITANITVATAAAVGARDVTVMDAGNNEVFKSTFTVAAPLQVTFQGTVAQGSLSLVHIDLVDHDNLFDTTAQSSLFGTTYTNIELKGGAGVNGVVQAVSPTSIDALLAIDVNAAAGTNDLEVVSGPPMGATDVHSLAPQSLMIAARTATTLPMGITMGNVSMPFDSQLYTFAPGAAMLSVNQLLLKATGGMMPNPAIYLLPKSGKWTDGTVAPDVSQTFTTTSTDPYYVVIFDGSGVSGYTYGLTRNYGTVTATASMEPNNNAAATANPIATLPALVTGAMFDATTDPNDWFSFTTSAADAGKKAHVVTFGDAGTTMAVDVTNALGTTVITGSDVGGFVDFTTTALAASTTYKIHVTVSAMAMFPQGGNYSLWLRLE
jgi:hypothetical protein